MKDARSGLYIDTDLQVSVKRLKLGVMCWRRRWGETIFHVRTVLEVISRLNRLVSFVKCNIYTSQAAIQWLLYIA